MTSQELAQLRKRIQELTPQWEDEFGIGNCGAIACLLRERGYGKVALTFFPDGAGLPTAHYVIAEPDGQMLDATGWCEDGGACEVHDLFDEDEYPDLYGEREVAWWRERI